jgi:CRISPR-associated protein Cas1
MYIISVEASEKIFFMFKHVIDIDIDTQAQARLNDPEKRKELGINKSTLWYQQKKIKEGNIIKVYGKTKVKIG